MQGRQQKKRRRTDMKAMGTVAVLGAVMVACAFSVRADGDAAAAGTGTEGKVEAHKAKMEARHQETTDAAAKRHEENMATLKEKLAKNKKLTDADKEEICKFVEEQYGENVSFRDEQFAENLKFLEELGNTDGLTKDQIKDKIK